MQFPPWADRPDLTPKERCQQRLAYLVSRLALFVDPRNSHRALAEFVGIDHSTISTSIRQGYFSPYIAKRIEGSLGRQQVRAEWLVDPLSIKTK